MDGAPEAVSGQVQALAPANGVRCARVPLEELFIELVGGER
jgi:hypothetical protein